MNPWVIFAAIVGVLMLSARRAIAFVNGNPVTIVLGGIGGDFELRADAANAFRAMAAAADDDGIALAVESAFRTSEKQASLYETFLSGGDLAARPGYSNHQGGIAVDIDVDRSFQSRVYLWLERNGKRFGFVNAGKYFSQPEPWHWEFRP